MNSTTCDQQPAATQYSTLGLALLTLLASLLQLLLKKEGMLDRIWPKPVPRKQTTRKLTTVEDRLSHIIIQLTNLTPQNSSESTNSNNDRIRSSAGFRGDRDGDSDEDVQRLRMCEEGRAGFEVQHAPATVLAQPSGIRSSDASRAESRRRQRTIELVRPTDERWHQAASRSSSGTSASSGPHQPSQRQALRSSGAPQRVEAGGSPPASSAQTRI
jgi:hypothetical protein